MDPLQPLPRRPKKASIGAWLLALGLLALAAVVLWLNLRPRRVTLQQRIEQVGERGRELLQGSASGETDPAVRSGDRPAQPSGAGARGQGQRRKP